MCNPFGIMKGFWAKSWMCIHRIKPMKLANDSLVFLCRSCLPIMCETATPEFHYGALTGYLSAISLLIRLHSTNDQ